MWNVFYSDWTGKWNHTALNLRRCAESDTGVI